MAGVFAGSVAMCLATFFQSMVPDAGPEVVVLLALIVVEVELGDAGLEEFEGCVDAFVIFRCA